MTITHDFEDMYGDDLDDSLGDWDEVSRPKKDNSKTIED